MNLNEILAKVSSSGIKIWAEGEELKLRAPKGALTADPKLCFTQLSIATN